MMLFKKIYYFLKIFSWSLIIFIYSINILKAEDKVSVETAKVITKQLHRNYKTIANIENINSKNFFAKTSGSVDLKLVTDGNIVKKNDIILAINHDIAETKKAKAELSYKLAKNKLVKDATLYKHKVISENVFNLTQLEFEKAKLELETAISDYDKHVIKAPFDGRIGLIKFAINDDVKLDDFLFTIISPGYKQAIITLPQKLYNQITVQNNITLVSEDGKKFTARITAIDPYVNKNTGNFTVKFEFDDPDNKFLHGSYTDVELAYATHAALAIAELAILVDEKGYYVYQIDDSAKDTIKVVKRYITTGSKLAGYVEVTKGLLIDDEVVVEGVNKLHEGSVVNIKESSNSVE